VKLTTQLQLVPKLRGRGLFFHLPSSLRGVHRNILPIPLFYSHPTSFFKIFLIFLSFFLYLFISFFLSSYLLSLTIFSFLSFLFIILLFVSLFLTLLQCRDPYGCAFRVRSLARAYSKYQDRSKYRSCSAPGCKVCTPRGKFLIIIAFRIYGLDNSGFRGMSPRTSNARENYFKRPLVFQYLYCCCILSRY
jgi:hypothetical protein